MKLLHEAIKGYTGSYKIVHRIYHDESRDEIYHEINGKRLELRDESDYNGVKIRSGIYYTINYRNSTLKVLRDLMDFESTRDIFSNSHNIRYEEYPTMNINNFKKIGYSHEESVLIMFYFMNVILEDCEEIYFKNKIFELVPYLHLHRTLPNRELNEDERLRVLNKINYENFTGWSNNKRNTYSYFLDIFTKNNIGVRDFKECVGIYLTFEDYEGLNSMEDISNYIQYKEVSKYINRQNTIKYIDIFIENSISLNYDLTLDEILKYSPPINILTENSIGTIKNNIELFRNNQRYLSWVSNSLISNYINIINDNFKFLDLFGIDKEIFIKNIEDDMFEYIKTNDISIVNKYNKLINKFKDGLDKTLYVTKVYGRNWAELSCEKHQESYSNAVDFVLEALNLEYEKGNSYLSESEADSILSCIWDRESEWGISFTCKSDIGCECFVKDLSKSKMSAKLKKKLLALDIDEYLNRGI